MKLPFTFNIKLVFRLLLPGFIVTTYSFPIIEYFLNLINIPYDKFYIYCFLVLFFGWIIVLLDNPIYMLFEGRRYWPKFIYNFFRTNECDRLHKILIQRHKNIHTNRQKYLEACFELRKFAIDTDGSYCANFPTRLGNLIDSYEKYPDTRYAMDSIAYWYRLWPLLDNNLKEQIDSQQSIADSGIYASFSLALGGFFCLLYYALSSCGITIVHFIQNETILIYLSIFFYATSYFIYRISLHQQYIYGEYFKSIFDNFRHVFDFDSVIKDINTNIGHEFINESSEFEKRRICSRYFQYYKVRHNGNNWPVPSYGKLRCKNISKK